MSSLGLDREDRSTRRLLPSAAAMTLLAVTVVSGGGKREVVAAASLLGVVTFLTLARPVVIRWRSLLGALVLVILFIPMRRYALPGSLPFQLEPSRVCVAGLVLAWLAGLLVVRRIHFR